MGASTLYSLGVALQAMDARQTPQHEYLRLGLARNLVKRGRWLFGTGLSLLGWPLQLLALSLAPLVVVQPAMAAGLLVLLVVGERMLGERAGRREHLAVGAIVVGVIGAALCAPPHTDAQASDAVLAIVLGALGLASLLPYIMLRLFRRPPAMRHDRRRGPGVRLERGGHQARLRQPALRVHCGWRSPGDSPRRRPPRSPRSAR